MAIAHNGIVDSLPNSGQSGLCTHVGVATWPWNLRAMGGQGPAGTRREQPFSDMVASLFYHFESGFLETLSMRDRFGLNTFFFFLNFFFFSFSGACASSASGVGFIFHNETLTTICDMTT